MEALTDQCCRAQGFGLLDLGDLQQNVLMGKHAAVASE
jgi:hypothetical protein